MALLPDPVNAYLTAHARTQHDSDVLQAMEARAQEHGFPIVGRAVGRFLEGAARSIGASRVFELGSGYGFSAYWFARAVGSTGEVHLTDGDPENAVHAEHHLRAAGLWDRVEFHTGDALTSFAAVDGEFDIVYCDVDKDGYPDCWRAACDRVRVGGLYLCDNTLWGGAVATGESRGRDGWTEAIVEHNRLVAEDERYISQIIPIRDGVMYALRVS